MPGIQIDGYFPDSSTTNTNHGWKHDAQFVLRLPDGWNGGLVVTGSPGNREQYANDRAISDWVLDRGYAFAATDKGNTGADFHRDGRAPGDADRRVEPPRHPTRPRRPRDRRRHYHRAALPHAGHGDVQRRLPRALAVGEPPRAVRRRRRLGRHPVAGKGQGPNLLTFLPPALRHYPAYAEGGAGAEKARKAMHAAGFPRRLRSSCGRTSTRTTGTSPSGSTARKPTPPSTAPPRPGTPFCAPGKPDGPPCDADYDYASRPDEVHRAVAKIGLTGRIGKPLITLHGTRDTLLPISKDSDVYARMVRDAGRGDLFRYYRVEDGNHVDSLADNYPDELRPLTPCHRSAFTALERWLDKGEEPPASHTVPRPEKASPEELLTSCPLN